MWISQSERSLKADELCHALALEIGSPNLNTDNVPSVGRLVACLQGLVVVDKITSMVRLIHFTLQEYLRAQPELSSTTHSVMAETCISFLNSQEVRALSTSPSLNPKAHLFSNIPLSIVESTKKGAFQIVRNLLHWSYLATTVIIYPPESSRIHRNHTCTILISIDFPYLVVRAVYPSSRSLKL